MKKRIIGVAIIIIGVVLGACKSDPEKTTLTVAVTNQPSNTPSPIESSPTISSRTQEPTSTLILPQTSSPTNTPTLTNTPLPTATLTPSATLTSSPTPTPEYNVPGYYHASGCTSYHLPRAGYNVDFCILHVIINQDGHMVFTTSWTVHFPKKGSIGKQSDAGNRQMYLVDNLGNRYDHVNTGGAAAEYVHMKDGDTVTGWFEFPAAQKNATSFTFYDDQQDVSLGGLKFSAPIILTEIVELTLYPLTLEYLKELWEVGETENGGILLSHADISMCQILEWEPSEVQGKYKNTVELGGVTYEIYGWLEDEWGVREYLAVQGIEDYDSSINPLFHAIIPYDDSLQCIFDVSGVLAELRIVEFGE